MSKAAVAEAQRSANKSTVEQATLEHVNVTTFAAQETAQLMVQAFGWHIRWEGPAKLGGHSIHVGTDGSYVALYTPPEDLKQARSEGQPNHVGVLVGDLDATEIKIRAAGYQPYAHADYEPGRRFYFRDRGGVEFEVVSYA
ncbi:MAG: VOC family protein [Hyphomonadaceae bacterium]|nr:VOC family protein [Hyphomonadaceae bacterium]MBP9235849.1 VOC family protein [Hyphomonadaceae bacterium]